MNCLFDDKKHCPLSEYNLTIVQMGRFCQACIGKAAFESIKVMRAQLILAMLRMFPKDEEKAKLEYQKLMKRVEEW